MASTNVAAERWEAAMVMSKVLQRTKTRKSISVKEIAARSRRSDLNPNPQKIAFFQHASPCAARTTGAGEAPAC